MEGIYRPRHPERTVLYRVLFHHFERFVAEYEERFERTYGYFRPIIKDVVEKYLDCGNPRCGFARIRCPDCREERLVREVLRLLVGKELLSPEWADRILSWPHTGFNVHSRVRAKT
ncbi:MAG: transposase zinc-binding domain-containing protein, partial [Candidatus Aminicenantes bacterium]|nr:transposase zinc-binding domain-containing protein [Candidatus Aminicenantes bacterium]